MEIDEEEIELSIEDQMELPELTEDELDEEPIEKEIVPKATKKRKHYVNNPDLLQALATYKQKCIDNAKENKPEPIIPNYIGECFMKIAEGLSHKPNFLGYTYRDEMVADGIENCVMYFRNFDPDKSKNPFAYFTQIIYFAFLRRIAKEKRQLYVKYKSTEQFGVLDEDHLLEMEGGSNRQFEMYDNIMEFIYNYEKTKDAKKPPKKKSELDIFED